MRRFKDEESASRADIIRDAIAEREALIVCALRRGHSRQQVADAFHVSKSYVNGIARKYHESSGAQQPNK